MRPALEQHERIKMQLRLAGSSLSRIARDLSVAATTVTSVSQGHRRSRRIEAAIAEKLGIMPQDLWLDRYPQGARDSNSEGNPPSHCRGYDSSSTAFY